MKREKTLDHSCKQTCSGWQQGFEAGERHTLDKLSLAFKKILTPESTGQLEKIIRDALVDKDG